MGRCVPRAHPYQLNLASADEPLIYSQYVRVQSLTFLSLWYDLLFLIRFCTALFEADIPQTLDPPLGENPPITRTTAQVMPPSPPVDDN